MKRSMKMVVLVVLTLVGGLLFAYVLTVQAAAQPGVMTRDLDNPAFQPIQETAQGFSGETNRSDIFPIYQVPAGKRAVIEFFSVQVTNNGGAECYARLVTNVTGGVFDDVYHGIPLTRVATIADDGVVMVYAAGQTTRLYAGPGTKIFVEFGRYHSFSGVMSCGATISGYLVDLPAK